jgi:hypothetical protein
MQGLHGWVVLLARTLFLAVPVLALPVSGFAKMYEEPKSFSLKDESQEKVQRKILPKVDTERLRAEDRLRDRNSQRPSPMRFAVAADVAFDLNNAGTWQTLPDGRLWRLRIQSTGATSLNLGITRFEMPDGAKLWIYDPGHEHVEGPYTSRHRSNLGSLRTPIIEGEEMVVEVFVPAGISQPVVEIGKANHGYRGFTKTGLLGNNEDACEIDVICPAGNPWRDQIRAVAVYTIGGMFACTGTLLNNTALDFRPLFLSANHCSVTSMNAGTSVVVYWNFQSPTCGPHTAGPLTDTQTGSTILARSALTDFLLLELSATPDPGFNVYYAGWDASGSGARTIGPTVGIHHPRADVKAISVASSPAYTNNGNYWQAPWDLNQETETGSSGSCLFDANTKRCIGQLYGNGSACGAVPRLPDSYGALSKSWDGGGTPTTRLKDYLDPGSTGSVSMDGDPHITTANGMHYDFQSAGEFVSLRDANGLEIQTRQSPIATTFNPGIDPHDGLATCVSINTAVAARVGNHRVTYQPNLSGVPDPSGLQLRVDGVLTTLGATGLDLGNGARIEKTAAPGGIEIDFPDSSVLLVTPSWWADQGKWYLNADVVRSPAIDGMTGAAPGSSAGAAAGGIAGAIAPGNWLPALPDGTSMGPMPGALHERYLDLYQKFADAWRVTDKTSLFDYAPSTSTDTFTMRTWPPEIPPCAIAAAKPARPVSQIVAQRACRPVTGENSHKNCVFDVMVTGNRGFARTYALSQRIRAGATTTALSDNKDSTKIEEPVTFTATVARIVRTGEGIPTGTVQLTLDGHKVGRPVRLDAQGQATWQTSSLKPGKHKLLAAYRPSKGSEFLASISAGRLHTVGGEPH